MLFIFPRVKKKATLKPGCEFFAEVHAVVYFIVLWKIEGFSRFQKYLTALLATVPYYCGYCSEVGCGDEIP